MARSINRAELLGFLGEDATVRKLDSGSEVATFRLATDRSWKDGSGEWREETDWHHVVVWSPGGLRDRLRKGARLFASGRLRTRSWEADGQTHWRTEVVCEGRDIIVVSPPSGGEGADSGTG